MDLVAAIVSNRILRFIMHTPIASQAENTILYEPSLFGKPEQQLFDPDYWLARNVATSIEGGRGQVIFIHDDQRNWVLRHYHRGGFIAKFNQDRYLWQGAEATRSFREWRLLAKLVDLDLPVPIPVAARYVRRGISYQADLITQEIIGAKSLATLLQKASLSPTQWQYIGLTLTRFHSHGVQHADLNAHNIVFDETMTMHLLDFDRGVIRAVNQGWIDQVLQRLLRSLNKLKVQRSIHFNMNDWRQLLTAHHKQLNY